MTAPRQAAPALLGLGLIALLSLSWGFHWPIMKIGLSEIPPLSFRGFATAIGGAGLLMMARLSGRRLWPRRRELPMLTCMALANITAWQLLTAYGLTLMPAGRAIILAYTMPLWAILLSAVALGETIDRRRLLGLVLGLAGMALLLGDEMLGIGRAPIGALLVVMGALFWAAGTVFTKGFTWQLSLTAMVGWQLLIGALPMVAGAALFEAGSWTMPSLWPLLALTYTIIIATFMANLVWFRILQIYPAGIASIFTLMNPVVGVAASALMLGERLGPAEIGALALVVGALAAVHRKREPA
ncbi:MAG: DMT family transporter [Alphaproteobacteria bacterium]|jgi:drug/metabolite transporter (DMT)-like permease|nr:DMT family transporter [Alphaproteobacteria bacterium]